MSFFDLTARSISGEPLALSRYRGQVVLVVNTASECGFTPQYAELETLHQELKSKGLVVLGFPSNDFGGQEPGTEEDIQQFCDLRFKVTFPLMAKVRTRGEDASEVFRFLSASHGEPKWNFHKYLVGRDGSVVESFSSITKPTSTKLRSAILQALDG